MNKSYSSFFKSFNKNLTYGNGSKTTVVEGLKDAVISMSDYLPLVREFESIINADYVTPILAITSTGETIKALPTTMLQRMNKLSKTTSNPRLAFAINNICLNESSQEDKLGENLFAALPDCIKNRYTLSDVKSAIDVHLKEGFKRILFQHIFPVPDRVPTEGTDVPLKALSKKYLTRVDSNFIDIIKQFRSGNSLEECCESLKVVVTHEENVKQSAAVTKIETIYNYLGLIQDPLFDEHLDELVKTIETVRGLTVEKGVTAVIRDLCNILGKYRSTDELDSDDKLIKYVIDMFKLPVNITHIVPKIKEVLTVPTTVEGLVKYEQALVVNSNVVNNMLSALKIRANTISPSANFAGTQVYTDLSKIVRINKEHQNVSKNMRLTIGYAIALSIIEDIGSAIKYGKKCKIIVK